MREDAARAALDATFAVLAALGPRRKLRHHAVDFAFDLVAFPPPLGFWTFEAAIVGLYDKGARQRLPTAAGVWIRGVRTAVIAVHRAIAGDPNAPIAVDDVLRRAGVARLQNARSQ